MDIDQAIWSGDLLGRQADAEFLQNFLLGRIKERRSDGETRSFVLNIDAPWGSGKSWFLEKFSTQLKASGYHVAKVNAWQNDYADDPLIPVMAAIDNAIKHLVKGNAKKKAWQSVKANGSAIAVSLVKGATVHWLRKGLGDGLDEAFAHIGSENDEATDAVTDAAADRVEKIFDTNAEKLLAHYRGEEKTIENFKFGLANLIKTLSTDDCVRPLFVLVDELDRCRPPFAIALLERIKHLFSIDNVIFVVATDTSQLQYAISTVYGGKFDSRAYLKRFFDRTYQFEAPSIESFVESLIANIPTDRLCLPELNSLKKCVLISVAYFDLSLRDIQQVVDHFHNICTAWKSSARIQAALLLPMIIAYHKGLAPAISNEYMANIQKLKTQARRVDTRYEFPRYGSSDGSNHNPGLANIISGYISLAQMPLSDIIKQDPSGIYSIWIQETFMEEMRSLGKDRMRGSVSIVQTYPSIIRQAGRLSE